MQVATVNVGRPSDNDIQGHNVSCRLSTMLGHGVRIGAVPLISDSDSRLTGGLSQKALCVPDDVPQGGALRLWGSRLLLGLPRPVPTVPKAPSRAAHPTVGSPPPPPRRRAMHTPPEVVKDSTRQ